MASSQLLGSHIQKLRRRAGLTQDELSHKAGLAYSTLAKIERGAIKNPSVFTIAALARALFVSLDELMAMQVVPKTGSSKNKIKFVYCDINGVLVDYHKIFVRVAEQNNMPVDKIESIFMRFNDPADRGEISVSDFDKLMGPKLRLSPFNWKRRYISGVEPVEPMATCLKAVSKQLPVGIISNNRAGFIDALLTRKLIPNIKYATVIDSSQVGIIKPDDHIFELAEKTAGVKPENILLIDDTAGNVAAAEARGWQVIHFNVYDPEGTVKRVYEALKMPTRSKKA